MIRSKYGTKDITMSEEHNTKETTQACLERLCEINYKLTKIWTDICDKYPGIGHLDCKAPLDAIRAAQTLVDILAEIEDAIEKLSKWKSDPKLKTVVWRRMTFFSHETLAKRMVSYFSYWKSHFIKNNSF